MPTIEQTLRNKDRALYCVTPDMSVLDATKVMNDEQIGSVLVMEDRKMVGIFTERDVLRRVVAAKRDPETTLVREVMTENPLCCHPHMDLDEAAQMMKQRRVRHLPVCEECGEPVGMLSIGDINATYARKQEQELEFLNGYIYGRV